VARSSRCSAAAAHNLAEVHNSAAGSILAVAEDTLADRIRFAGTGSAAEASVRVVLWLRSLAVSYNFPTRLVYQSRRNLPTL